MKRLTTFLLTLLLFTLGASAQTDFTWKLNIDTWTGNTGVWGTDGAKERYGDEIAVSGDPVKVLYQTVTDLPAGDYTLKFYAVANNAWVGSATGSGIAQVYVTANGETKTENVTVYDQTGITDITAYSYTYTVTVGSDGTLEYGLQNVATGGNWYVAQGVSLTYSGDYTPAEGDQVYGCTTMFSHWGITGNTGQEAFQLNTWSTATGMSLPTCEYWVYNTSNLTAATLSHETLTGLQAGTYEVSIKASATAENASGSVGEGTTFNANEASVDLTTGTYSVPTNMGGNYCGTYTVEATVDDAGTLDISFTIPSGVTYNWLQFQDLSVTLKELAAEEEEPEPEPEPEDDGAYKFVCTDWVGVSGRSAESGQVTYSEDGSNTITVNATGSNNTALFNGTGEYSVNTTEYYITAEQKYFIVVGTDLHTEAEDNTYSQLWWMNGVGGPTAKPDYVVELAATGEVLFAWDLTTITEYSTVLTPDGDGKIYLTGWTGFGLTTTGTSSTISDINFYTEEELQAIIASDEEPGTFEPTTVSYTDCLHVVLGSEDEVMEATVDVEYTAANVINFTLYDLAVAGTNVGNVTVTGITLEDDGDGVCSFSYSGSDVTVSGGDFDSLINLVSITIEISGDITEEKLHANMTVDVTMGSSSLLSITADFGYSEEPEPEPEVVHECVAEESHWTTDGTTGIAYNTWSVEEDASGMVAPFLQLWVWGLDATQPSLEAATISHETLTDLEPGSYEVSLDIRIYSEVGNEIGEGTTFNANGVSADLLLEGNEATNSTDDYEHETLVYGTYVLTCTVGEAGTLDISINIPEGVDYNWIAWKNLTVTYIGEAEPEPEDLSELIAQYEADCTAAEGCEADLADMIENGDKTDETKAEMAEALEALEAVMAEYGNIDTTATTAEELTEAIAAIEAALAEAQDVYTTGLQSVTVATEDDAIYTLSGVRVSKAVKGVYIVNGKKVLVK